MDARGTTFRVYSMNNIGVRDGLRKQAWSMGLETNTECGDGTLGVVKFIFTGRSQQVLTVSGPEAVVEAFDRSVRNSNLFEG